MQAVDCAGKRVPCGRIHLHDVDECLLRPFDFHIDRTARGICKRDVLVSGELQRACMIVDRVLCSDCVSSGILRSGSGCGRQEETVPAVDRDGSCPCRSPGNIVQRHAALQCDRRSILRISLIGECTCFVYILRCGICTISIERCEFNISGIRKLFQVSDDILNQVLRLITQVAAPCIRVDITHQVMRDAIVVCIGGAPALRHDGLDIDSADRISERRAAVHVEQRLAENPLISTAVKVHIFCIGGIARRRRLFRFDTECLHLFGHAVYAITDIFHMVVGLCIDKGTAQ